MRKIIILIFTYICFNVISDASPISNGALTAIKVDATENAGCVNGGIDINISGGYSPYFIEWSHDSEETSLNLQNLSTGTYCITITDDKCGVANQCWEIKCCPFILDENQIQYEIINPACPDGLGAFDISLMNLNTNDFPLQINLINTSLQKQYYNEITTPLSTIENLNYGNYEAEIRYGEDECTYDFEFSIEIIDIEIEFLSTSDCGAGGSVEVVATNGVGEYTYMWSDNPSVNESYREGLDSKFYTITVFDENECNATASVYVKSGIDFSAEDIPVSIDAPICNDNNGKIDFFNGADFGIVSYLWDNGSTEDEISNLGAGEYSVELRNEDGCVNIRTFELFDIGAPVIILEAIEHSCVSDATGLIVVIAESGNGNELSYEWSTGFTDTEFLENLAIGEYCLTITDLGNGCSTAKCYTIEEIVDIEVLLIASHTEIQESCNSGSNGFIDLKITGGKHPIEYLWSNGENTRKIENLLPGEYTVTVSDQCGQEIEQSFEIESVESVINVESTIYCLNRNTGLGSIDLTVTGSNGPFTFQWDNGVIVTEDREVISEGTYTVEIQDQNGCSIQESFYVGETEGDLQVIVNDVDLSNCESPIELLASAIVSGGNPPYKFKWTGGSTASTMNFSWPNGNESPVPLNYAVTVTDDCNNEEIVRSTKYCEEYCDDNCIEFYRSGDAFCVDLCGDAGLGIFELGCDQLEIKSSCDDDISRTFYWNDLTGTSGETSTFIGEDLMEGDIDETDVVSSGPGYANAYVKNNVTGCVKWVSIFIPGKCFSLWNWIWDCEHCGDFGDGVSGPVDDDTECNTWEIEEDGNCSITWICVDPPDEYDNIIDVVEEVCYIDVETQAGDSEEILLYGSCDCSILEFETPLSSTNREGYCECAENNIVNPVFDPSLNYSLCNKNPKDIYYDFDQDKFIYLTTNYENDTLVYPQVTTRKLTLDTSKVFSPIKGENSFVHSIVLDSVRNIIIHTVSYDGSENVIKYDTLGQTIWEYKFSYTQIIDVSVTSHIKNQTKLRAKYSDKIVEVVIHENGDVLNYVEIPLSNESYFTVTSDSYLSVNYITEEVNEFAYSSTESNWALQMPSQILVKRYFEDMNGNIVVFFNYKTSFSLSGKVFLVTDKISSGAILISESGSILKSYLFPYATNFIVTDVAMGSDNLFGLIGYYSNRELVDCNQFHSNEELCSFILGFDLNYEIVNSRNDVENKEQEFSIYPNPTSESEINLELNFGKLEGVLSVYNSQNTLIYQNENFTLKSNSRSTIHLDENLKSGVYFLNFENDSLNISKKVILIR